MRFYSKIHINLNDIEESLIFECDFYYESIQVYTENSELILRDISGISGPINLAEAIARNRPRIIAILDIISFLIGHPINVYNIVSQSYSDGSSKMVVKDSGTVFFLQW